MNRENTVLRITGITAGYLILSASLAMLFLSAKQALALNSIIFSLTAWIGYLITHYFETGVLIDPKIEKKVLPETETNWALSGISALLFLIGMSFGSLGVSQGSFAYSFTGASTLILGYFIAHYEFSDSIV